VAVAVVVVVVVVVVGSRVYHRSIMSTRSPFLSPYGVPFVDLDQFDIGPEVIAWVPAAIAWKYRALPINRAGDTLIVALADPTNESTIAHLADTVGVKIEVVAASADALQAALEKYYPLPN
jgi:type IV pilus assembly protein PilB